MIECKNCKTIVDGDANFCTKCGTRLKDIYHIPDNYTIFSIDETEIENSKSEDLKKCICIPFTVGVKSAESIIAHIKDELSSDGYQINYNSKKEVMDNAKSGKLDLPVISTINRCFTELYNVVDCYKIIESENTESESPYKLHYKLNIIFTILSYSKSEADELSDKICKSVLNNSNDADIKDPINSNSIVPIFGNKMVYQSVISVTIPRSTYVNKSDLESNNMHPKDQLDNMETLSEYLNKLINVTPVVCSTLKNIGTTVNLPERITSIKDLKFVYLAAKITPTIKHNAPDCVYQYCELHNAITSILCMHKIEDKYQDIRFIDIIINRMKNDKKSYLEVLQDSKSEFANTLFNEEMYARMVAEEIRQQQYEYEMEQANSRSSNSCGLLGTAIAAAYAYDARKERKKQTELIEQHNRDMDRRERDARHREAIESQMMFDAVLKANRERRRKGQPELPLPPRKWY